MSTGSGGARDGRPSRRRLLTAGLAAAVAGTGGWRTAPAEPGHGVRITQARVAPIPTAAGGH